MEFYSKRSGGIDRAVVIEDPSSLVARKCKGEYRDKVLDDKKFLVSISVSE